jgi:tetratricopeptide (TPR) repeat protein
MADGHRPGPEDGCPCGSGRTFERCHGAPGLDDEGNDATALHDLGVECLGSGRLREAIERLESSIALRPTFARAHFHLGRALAQSGQDDAALAAHRRAIALDPDMGEAHGRAAAILMRQGKREEAVSAYLKATAAEPDTVFGGLCHAGALMAQNRATEAEEALRRLIARDPSCGEAHLELGHLLNEAGSFAESATAFEQAIALATPSTGGAPWLSTAYHRLVGSRRVTEADRPLLARILSLLEAPGMAERANALTALHFAAGKALDDLGDYEGAIRHFDAAHEIRRRGAAFDRHHFRRAVDGLIARFTPEFFARQSGTGDDDETPVLVLGMPRSGTTLIERMISSHPQVGGGGELSFWSVHGPAWMDGGADTRVERISRLRGDYLALLRSIAPAALRVTDKLPFNFLWAGIVHMLLPRARVVHCRRNPIDTCLSIYANHFAHNWRFANDRGDLAAYYRQYLRLMDHWREVLPADRLLEVDYEDATAAPEATARRLIAFCGLEWDPACLHPERNPDVVQTASMWQARQPIYRSSVERWRRYEPWLGELRGLLPAEA